MAWFLAWLYMRAARRFDAMGKSVLHHLQRHKDRRTAKGDSYVDAPYHVSGLYRHHPGHRVLGGETIERREPYLAAGAR